MPEDKWVTGAADFDTLYGNRSWESRIPYFGRVLTSGLARRENFALEFAGELEDKTILDLGCGVGRFALQAAARGARVYGYDISPEAIEIARQSAAAAELADRCHFAAVDLLECEFPEADMWFDLGCLQYIRDLEPLLQRLRGKGRFFSELPRRGHWLHVPRRLYRGVLKGNPYYTYSEVEIRELFRGATELRVEARGISFYITGN